MFTYPYRILRNLDYVLITLIIILLLISLLVIGSATHINIPIEDRYWYVGRQGIFTFLNLIFIIFFLMFDYKKLHKIVWFLYILNLFMLIGVIILGKSALGAQRWIQIGPVNIQPSEISKLVMIIVLAAFIDKNKNKINSYYVLLKLILIIGVPFILVLKQPDLGTALVFLSITCGIIFVSGIKIKYIWKAFVGIFFTSPIFWHFMKDYQKTRLSIFLDPNSDVIGSGYHVLQSKIAIGSGQIFGKGLFHGTQSQLNFLPENHTDFIFAVIGEEFGFLGSTILLILYFSILYRMLKIATQSREPFGMLLAIGIFSMFLFHILVNIGMTVGIMPVTGIPCPLLSYGISSLTTNLLSVGILLNIYLRRKNLNF